MGLLSPGGSVQNGKFWLGEQLRGERSEFRFSFRAVTFFTF